MTLTKPPVETYQALPESCSDDKGPLRRATNRTRPCILCALLAATQIATGGSGRITPWGTFYFAEKGNFLFCVDMSSEDCACVGAT